MSDLYMNVYYALFKACLNFLNWWHIGYMKIVDISNSGLNRLFLLESGLLGVR